MTTTAIEKEEVRAYGTVGSVYTTQTSHDDAPEESLREGWYQFEINKRVRVSFVESLGHGGPAWVYYGTEEPAVYV